jgi:ubiquinone/menaquinone biosynthesis C-methylase UbiE
MTRPIGDSGHVDRRPWDERWDERYAATEFDPDRPPNQIVTAEVGALPPGRALDLAAGAGRHSVWLAERGWRVTAVDFSRVGLALARKLGAARGVAEAQVDWVVADVSDYEPERGAYDLALISYLQAGSEVRATALTRAAAALAPGGTMFVVGFDAANLTEGTGRPRDPDVLYTPEAVRAQLPGLRILRAERVYHSVQTAAGPATAVGTVVRAVREP